MSSISISQNLSLLFLGLSLIIGATALHGWGNCANIITSKDCFVNKSPAGENLVKSSLILSIIFLSIGLVIELASSCFSNLRENVWYFRAQLGISILSTLVLLAGVLMVTHLLDDIYSYMSAAVGCGFVLQGFLNYFSMIAIESSPKDKKKNEK